MFVNILNKVYKVKYKNRILIETDPKLVAWDWTYPKKYLQYLQMERKIVSVQYGNKI